MSALVPSASFPAYNLLLHFAGVVAIALMASHNFVHIFTGTRQITHFPTCLLLSQDFCNTLNQQLSPPTAPRSLLIACDDEDLDDSRVAVTVRAPNDAAIDLIDANCRQAPENRGPKAFLGTSTVSVLFGLSQTYCHAHIFRLIPRSRMADKFLVDFLTPSAATLVVTAFIRFQDLCNSKRFQSPLSGLKSGLISGRNSNSELKSVFIECADSELLQSSTCRHVNVEQFPRGRHFVNVLHKHAYGTSTTVLVMSRLLLGNHAVCFYFALPCSTIGPSHRWYLQANAAPEEYAMFKWIMPRIFRLESRPTKSAARRSRFPLSRRVWSVGVCPTSVTKVTAFDNSSGGEQLPQETWDDKNAVLRNYMEGEEELCRTSDVINSTLQYGGMLLERTETEYSFRVGKYDTLGLEVLNFMVLKWGLRKKFMAAPVVQTENASTQRYSPPETSLWSEGYVMRPATEIHAAFHDSEAGCCSPDSPTETKLVLGKINLRRLSRPQNLASVERPCEELKHVHFCPRKFQIRNFSLERHVHSISRLFNKTQCRVRPQPQIDAGGQVNTNLQGAFHVSHSPHLTALVGHQPVPQFYVLTGSKTGYAPVPSSQFFYG
ncbi:hypothetical protein C8R45DRAFT_944288 [Mycena sanguinolenta]|nr:hypothetical protein C8R45DRAFT_944288 [Mycena sanguinolenta]